MQISVIIPTYNGAHKIVNLLKSLENQTLLDFEVIVVIDGSTDNTLQILQTWEKKMKNLIVLNKKNGGRSVARNSGVKVSKGDLLVFFDDDMRIASNDCLLLHNKFHVDNPRVVCVGIQIEDYAVMKTDMQQFKAHCSRIWFKPLEELDEPMNNDTLFLTAAHVSIPRTLFDSVNGFDERLTDAEDFDLGVRLLEKGISIFFNKSILAWHDDFITMKSYLRRNVQYREAHKKLLLLSPSLYTEKYAKFQKKEVLVGFKKIVTSILSWNMWVVLIDMDIFKYFVPKKLRYKLYSLVLYSHQMQIN